MLIRLHRQQANHARFRTRSFVLAENATPPPRHAGAPAHRRGIVSCHRHGVNWGLGPPRHPGGRPRPVRLTRQAGTPLSDGSGWAVPPAVSRRPRRSDVISVAARSLPKRQASRLSRRERARCTSAGVFRISEGFDEGETATLAAIVRAPPKTPGSIGSGDQAPFRVLALTGDDSSGLRPPPGDAAMSGIAGRRLAALEQPHNSSSVQQVRHQRARGPAPTVVGRLVDSANPDINRAFDVLDVPQRTRKTSSKLWT